MGLRQLKIFLIDQKAYKRVYLDFIGIYFQVIIGFEQLGVGRSGEIKMLCVWRGSPDELKSVI